MFPRFMRRLSIKKLLLLTALVNILQTLCVITIVILDTAFNYDTKLYAEFYLMPILLLTSLAGTAFSVALPGYLSRINLRLSQSDASIADLNRLHIILRSQRHDFMNHLQVVHSLIELREFAEANAYIETVYESIEKISLILKTAIPAVNAILQAKRQMCEARGIVVKIDIRSSLTGISIPAWELCRVLGNIIDNSIHALSLIDSDKLVEIEIYEDLSSFKFEISNNGPIIPHTIRNRIFEPGFTTRHDSGEGMGLTICRRILNDVGGSLSLSSDELKTVFTASVPKNSAPVISSPVSDI